MLGQGLTISWLLVASFSLFTCGPTKDDSAIALCSPVGAKGFPKPNVVIDVGRKSVTTFDASSPLQSCGDPSHVCLDGNLTYVAPGAYLNNIRIIKNGNIQIFVHYYENAPSLNTVYIERTNGKSESKYIYNFNPDGSVFSLQIIRDAQEYKGSEFLTACHK
jgi:hypothetical protein